MWWERAGLNAELAASTPKAWELAHSIDDRIADGWDADDLVERLVEAWPDEVMSPVRLLAWRIDQLPIEGPQPTGPETTDEEGVDHFRCSGTRKWVVIDDSDALVCEDCWELPEPLRPAPFVVAARPVVEDEATAPSTPETSPERVTDASLSASIEAPEAMPAHDVDEGADDRLCDVQVPAVASSSGSRQVIDLDVDEVTGPTEPAPRPPTPDAEAIERARAAVGAMTGGSRPERGRRPFGAPIDEPRPAFGLPTSPERPVGARLSASEGIRGVIAPETPERGADGDAAQARADRLRANHAAREAKRAQESRHVPQWQAAS